MINNLVELRNGEECMVLLKAKFLLVRFYHLKRDTYIKVKVLLNGESFNYKICSLAPMAK